MYTSAPLLPSARARLQIPPQSISLEEPRKPHVPVCNRFGLRLRQLRKEHGYSQLKLADLFGIDRSYVSDVERGRKAVSISMLEVFALGFEMSIAELLKEI